VTALAALSLCMSSTYVFIGYTGLGIFLYAESEEHFTTEILL